MAGVLSLLAAACTVDRWSRHARIGVRGRARSTRVRRGSDPLARWETGRGIRLIGRGPTADPGPVARPRSAAVRGTTLARGRVRSKTHLRRMLADAIKIDYF